ncbi:MAG TPA: hypothetical protein VMB25_22040 [Bryobacteraceae bacterium]|nr:hypothetical protein [Bryobacteraceae bacterium]
MGNALNGQDADGANNMRTTVTNATGTISQLNYGADGSVQGFLVGTDILLSFPTDICGGIGSLGVAGNDVTYSGTAFTTASGFQTVLVSSFTNDNTKAAYTAPTFKSKPAAYGPTSGVIAQLNYSPGGAIDGFVFSAGGSSILVSTGPRASSTLSSLLVKGDTVSVTGTTSSALSACASTGTLEVVDASSLTVGGQTIVIAGGGSPFEGLGGLGGYR